MIKDYNTKNKKTDKEIGEIVKVGKYACVTTKTANILRIVKDNRYIVRCNYGKIEIIDKKSGVKKIVNKNTTKIVKTYDDAKRLLKEVEKIREQSKMGIDKSELVIQKYTVRDAIGMFQTTQTYTDLTESYKQHYKNYFNHFIDFMGDKEVRTIKVKDIEQYYDYQLHRGNLSTAKKRKDGKVSKKEITNSNPDGISVNTLAKHKTALKNLWKYMLREEIFGVEYNVPALSEIPMVEQEIDGKIIKTRHIAPVRTVLTLEQLNYTLNDAIQNETDRSIVLMIALGALCGLRRSEIAGLKVGRYYHDNKMLLGEHVWELGDFRGIRKYYEEHNELILIDDAIMHENTDQLKFPKENTIRMVGKPRCLEKIVEYYMEQRDQINNLLDEKVDGSQRLYIPLGNLISQREFQSGKITRRWTEYQERRNKRMIQNGLEPIPVVRLHDLRHTHASLLSMEINSVQISRNMGHIVHGDRQVSNTTTKVYIHDREPDRSQIIGYWDKNIHIDWSKAMEFHIGNGKGSINVNGSGHVVIGKKHV